MVTKTNNKIEEAAQELEGNIIKEIFKEAEEVARLHTIITSPRGNYFRKKLLHRLQNELSVSEIENMAREFGLEEHKRHLHKLEDYKLIKQIEKEKYIRTDFGERIVNILRKLENKIGDEKTQKIYKAFLGPNSIRLFLRVFGQNKEPDSVTGDIKYSPHEFGHLTYFFVRTIEGMAAIDTLDDAELVSFQEDGSIRVNPRRSAAFYRYLKNLYKVLREIEKIH